MSIFIEICTYTNKMFYILLNNRIIKRNIFKEQNADVTMQNIITKYRDRDIFMKLSLKNRTQIVEDPDCHIS